MEYKKLFGLDVEFNWKTISMLALLAILPNLLGMIQTSAFGINIHFFQYAIFVAAIIYGPFGGAISGAAGSVYTAMAMNNPYILIGNVILGTIVGLLVRLDWNAILAVLVAFAVQLPWLWATDVYVIGMPVKAVEMIIVALAISNLVWAIVAMKTNKYFKKLIA